MITRIRIGEASDHQILCSPDGTPRFRLAGASHDRGRLRVRLEVLGEQHFYGLGQGGGGFDRLGQSRLLWNAHVNHGTAGDIAIPLMLSHVGVGLFFDTASRAWIDPGDSYDQTWIDFSVDADGLDLYFLAAADLRALMAEVATLLGSAPMPPRWVLGYMQSTRHFADAAELAALVPQFRDQGLPIDAIALLSSYGSALGWNDGVGSLDVASELLADPAAIFAAWHADHVKIVLHEYPVLGRASPLHAEAMARGALLDAAYPEAAAAGQPAANWHAGQNFLDFGKEDCAAWWWDQHRGLRALGVDGWWLDGGEGPFPEAGDSEISALHNRYDRLRQRAFAAGEARDRPERRAFLLCRSGGAGMQAHGAACWSGDVNGTFATLAAQIPIGLNVGMSGVPWWGTDIGGYYETLPDTTELFVRWFQFGAFCPVFRAHGREWRHHLPWSHGEAVLAICRTYLELRYRLFPYNYTLAWEAHMTGLPLMRPLVLRYPDDPSLRDVGDQYLWGDHLLVAPVTRPGATSWPVQLPPGIWHDFWTHEMYEGGQGITVAAPLDRLPLLVASGAILPLGPPVLHLDDLGPPPLTVLIYPAGQSAFTLYEDDGTRGAETAGRHRLIRFQCHATSDDIVCRVGECSEPREERCCTLLIRLAGTATSIQHLSGHPVLGWRQDTHFVVVPLAHLPAAIRLVLA